ncbi:hypothetical protein P691DRAFT_765260 [Macrolepiota fuliginosa MF-IS2]|uniref:Uncharacterized protein n=1 Tax=Macrolepiota fuliginosa MF-IS2 TaxID=1400762 RepID=A0A9P5X2G2_9AGAR|nr:hypothetical protein P691DRAFT_765260 [Macrolepiota fuliginosa MF-IS2]
MTKPIQLKLKITVPLRIYIHANAIGIDSAVTAQLSKALEQVWPSIKRKYRNAEETIELGLINSPHQSPGAPYPHWTFKWIYRRHKVVGTLHLPGRDGRAVDWWWDIRRKWKKRDVSAEFWSWGSIECVVIAKGNTIASKWA